MKIAWLLVWGLSWGLAAAVLRFATDESLDEILEDERHTLSAVRLEPSRAATWSKEYVQLLISCAHGTLQLAREVETSLVDTTFLCVGNDQGKRSIGVFTTAQEARQILSGIVYQPDANYHSTWYGVTDPWCVAGTGGHEVVRMQLSPLTRGIQKTTQDACVAVDLDDRASETVSTHEKKISVASVNDAPTVEREPGTTLSVHSGGSCVGLSGFKLGDAEAVAVESDPTALVPILRLDLHVKFGKLRVNRRSALQNAIHVVGNDGKNTGDATLAWTLPDLADTSLVMKGAISDLDEFLPAVEYCSSPDPKVVIADKLRVTLSDNGFCGSASKASLSTSLEVPVNIIPVVDLGELLFTNNNITLVTHSAQVALQYTPGTNEEVDCALELKYDDGMLLGIDYQAGTVYRKPNLLSFDASRARAEVLIPARGLIVRFWGEKSKWEVTSFKLTRHACAVNEICHKVESTSLNEGSSDEELLAAVQMLTFSNESVTDLQVIRYPVSRLWLIWNIPGTFGQEVAISKQTHVSMQTVGRRFHLHGKSKNVVSQLKTLNIYSLMGGIQSYNRLNVMVSTDAKMIGDQAVLSAQLDVFSASVLENIGLVYPRELALSDSREASLNNVSIWYPSTYASNTILKWTIRSTLGSIWWDPRLVSPVVVSRQVSEHDLELRGDLVDLNAALSNIRVDVSNIQEVYSSFMTIYDDQTYDLLAVALTQTDSIQTLTISDITLDESCGTDLFQLRVQNRVTSPLDSCANASTLENAIRDLSIDKLSVSVKRKASSFVLGRFDYTIVMSAPAGISLDLVADGPAPLSKTLFESSHVSPGSENQIAIATISMSLERSDSSSLVASGEMRVRVSRLRKKLGIRLPASYFQVHFNQTLTIEGVNFEGYAHKLTFSVSCTKGTVSILPKQLSQPLLSKSLDLESTLEISGYFSTLKTALGHSRLVYSPKNGASGYDTLVFIIASADDQARETLPILIESHLKPPSLTFPVTSMSVFENDFVRIEGVTLILEHVEQQSRISRGISLNVTTLNGELDSHCGHNSQLTKSIQIQGDIDNINAALKGLRYQAPARGVTEDHIIFSTHWITESRAQISPATITLSIKITKRPVTVNILINGSIVGDSSVLTTIMGTPVSLGSLSLQLDDDAQGWRHCDNTAEAVTTSECNATVELSLFAAHGLLTDRSEPLSEENISQESESPLPLARFIGSVIQATMYLQRQLYTPDAKFHGPDQIVITVKYTDGMTEDTVLLPVYVLPDCDAPRLSWAITGASTLDFRSSTRAPFSLPELLLTREGLEKRYCQDGAVFRVTLKTSQGYLRSKALEAERFDDRLDLAFEGRLWDLNLALSSVEYQFEIRRDTRIPVMATIEAHVYEKDDRTTAVSSASLRLKFLGDTRPPDMLVRETVTVSEDTDLMIGEMINIDAFVDLADDSTISISVHNGAIYASSNELHMEASSEQQVSIRYLRSVMSNLHYVPILNFNGIDEIDFKVQGQMSTLYVYVQPVNDPPTFVLNSDEGKDWYQYPRMFLPSFQLADPDKNEIFQVEIRVDNGSFFVDQISTSIFDGITMELSTSSSLRLTSKKNRLNTVFLQRLIEIIPTSCPSDGTTKKSCATFIELCVDDGASSVCEELYIPEQDLFYHVTVPNWAKSLNVSAGSSVNISQAFEVHQRFEVMYELIARIDVSSGFFNMTEVPSCAELLDVIDAGEPQIGMTLRILVPGVGCLNNALALIQLQSTYHTSNIIATRLELFDEEMRLLADASFNVNVTENMPPTRISAVRTISNETWVTQRGGYANLTSLLAVSITVDPNYSSVNEDGDDVLEMNISCFDCQWRYRVFVPRVSYEFANIASSMIKFFGVRDALNKVLATLEIAIASNSSSGSETIRFQLAPVLVLGVGPVWKDSTNISIPFTIQSSPRTWQAQQLMMNYTANLRDTEHAAVESTQESFAGAASIDFQLRAFSKQPDATLALRDASMVIQVNQDEAQQIGDLLIVSGDPEDPTWFRMEARVAHGILSIPINVCCVDIRETKDESELDVVGSALALKHAIAATRFQSNHLFSGKDLLEVTITHFHSEPNRLNVSFSIPIDIVAVNHVPSIGHQQRFVQDGGSSFLEEPIFDPTENEQNRASQSLALDAMSSVRGHFDMDSEVELTPLQPPAKSSPGQNSITSLVGTIPTKSVADTEAAVAVPLLHIEGSIEGPLSSQYWQVVTLALKVGKSWSIPGVSVGITNSWDGSKRPLLRDDNIMLEIGTDIGALLLSEWDGLEMFKGREDTYTTAVAVSGKMDRLNAALQTLRYQCTDGCIQQATITLQVRNPLASPPGVLHKRVIRVDQLYDVPVPRVIAKTSLYYTTEDSAFQFPDLALQFDDKNVTRETIATGRAIPRQESSPLYEIDVRVSYGTISVLSTDSIPNDDQLTLVHKSGNSALKLKGTVINLKDDLNRLIYAPPQNWNEEQFPGGHIVEWNFVVSYENETSESFADLVVTPRVDDPVITVPRALEDPFHSMKDYLSVFRLECLPFVCDEDTPLTLDGFSVRSADVTPRQLSTTDLLELTLSVSHGVITLGDTLRANCISKFMGPQSWKRVSFKATVDCLNRVLKSMTYVGEPNFSGADQLKIRVEYTRGSDAAFDEVLVPIIVVELNDAPYIDVTSVFFEAEEDIPLLIENLHLRDPDTQEKSIRVTMETSCGYLAVLRFNGVKLSTERVKGASSEATKLTLDGTLRNVKAAVASVVYTSAKDWNSLQFRPGDAKTTMNGFDTITIYSTDFQSFNGSSVSVLFVYVEPAPDPVVIEIPTNAETSVYANDLPGQLRGDEDTWVDVKGLAFSSADDTSRMTLAVSLSVSHGILALSDLSGLTFLEGTADKDSTIKFKGTFANVNACVGLRYLPDKDFYGGDSLVVSAKAVDEYTQQHTPSSSIDVTITVNPVNDAPLWNIGSSTVRKIQQSQAASIRGIYFQDIDIATLNCVVDSCLMDLIVEASNGFVTISEEMPPSFSNDVTTKKVTYLVISGTPDMLNRMLAEMTFELAGSEYYRADSPSRSDIKLQLTIDDRGTFGRGGPQVSTATVVYNPVTWSRYDLSILAPENVLTLDEDTAFVFDGDLQLVDPDASRSFQNLLELTIRCSHGAFALSSSVTGIQVLRNDSDGNIIIRGFFAQLNMALNGSSYIPSTNWYGSEHLSLSVLELNRPEKSREGAAASVFLFVASVCDEPQWSSLLRMAKPLTVKEDGYLLIDTLSLTNPDLDNEQREVEVSIDVNHGGVMLSMTRGLLIQQAGYSTSEDRLIAQHAPAAYSYSESRLFFKDLVFRGRVSDINAALGGMIFKPGLDYNSDGLPVDEILFVATSVCSSSALSANTITIQIAIVAVNDPPVLVSQNFQPIPLAYSARDLSDVALRSSIEAVEDLPQPLESTELYDPDFNLRSNDLRLLVNISCIHCTVTSEHLSQSSEGQASDLIVVTRTWRNEEGVQFIVHGNLPSLNDGLMNQLVFESARNFNGHAFVLIEISDLGNYGEGGEQRAIFALCVNVKPVNDMPQVHLPQYQSQEPILQLDEDASVLIQGAPALSAVSVASRRNTSTWNVMSANLLANDTSTRLQSLHQFSGPEGLTLSFLVAYKGVLLFSGRDPDFGQELWSSDGTAAGTVLLKDIFPGSGGSNPSYLTSFSTDNRVYFAAKGPHLSWLLKDDYQDTCQSFRSSSLNSNVYFAVAAQNVWDPDETYDCPLGFRWMSTSEAHEVFVGTVAFEGYSEEHFTYFDQCGWRGYEWGSQIRKYFRFSDSKATGAFKHAGFRDSYRVDTGFQTDLFAGIICYREPLAHQVTWGTQLWATDGTATGTQRIARISTDPEGSNPSHFAELNQRLYFQASSTDFGSELWSTDGTRDGTYLVADVEFGSRSSEPRFLIAFDSRVFFSAKTQDYGRELWFSDGNPRLDFSEEQHATVGTGLLFDICLGSKSSSPQHLTALSPLAGPPLLVFQADDCIHGPELWSTDGTRTGTKLVLDIHEGSAGSLPVYLTSFSGKVYFQADDGTHGAELWTTDGSSSGTVMLVDIAPGVLGSRPSFFTILDNINAPPGALIFAAQAERDRLTEFWRSDGTTAGTTKLFPQSHEVVEINTDSMDLQHVGHRLVTISSWPASFFFLGRQSGQGIDFQWEAADRPSVTHAEDIAQTRSITLQDIESLQNKRELTLSLNCSKGWLSLGRQCDGVSLSFDDALDKKKPAVVTLKGSLNALNCAVEKVTYHSKPQENGWDEIHVTLSQSVLVDRVASSETNGASNFIDDAERDSSYTVSERMLVEIRAINDPPIITMGSTFYAPLRQWVMLGEIEIDDPDANEGMLYVSISVRNGRLRARLVPPISSRGPAILHATVDGDTLQMLEFAVTVEQAKVIFESLEYSCDDRYGCSNAQRDYVTVQVDDNGFTGAHGPQVTTKTAEIFVIP